MIHISTLIDFVRNDKSQQECLQALAEHRKGDLEMYIQSGIFYIPPIEQADEWAYLCEQTGKTLEDFGVTEENRHLLDDGFILPVQDADGYVLFYLNHNFLRDKSMKYLNVNTPLAPNTQQVKLYGLHNTKQALEEDRVFVLEGYFDARRLEYSGFPATAPLGTKIMPYHINYYHRFRNVYYVQDNDKSGEMAYLKFKKEVPHAMRITMPSGFKDADMLGGEHPQKYAQWLATLPTL